MMATTILLVGFIGVIQAITIGSESLDVARKLQVANQIITAEVEKLRGSDWSVIANLPPNASNPTPTPTISIDSGGVITGDTDSFALTSRTKATTADDNTDLASLAKGFTCSFTRTYLRPAAATVSTVTFVKVTYTVKWLSNTNRPKSHQVSAYFGKNGLQLSYQQS